MRGRLKSKNISFLCLVLSLVLTPVCPMEVSTPEEVRASRGRSVTLKCSFWSKVRGTSGLSVDWSFRRGSSSGSRTFFHFSSVPYPPRQEPFRGRVLWLGNPQYGDVSIQLLNTSLNDNGTYTCAVRNPPDVHGTPAHIQLTVTPEELTRRFSDVAVLLALVLLPSAVAVAILLVRLCCCSRRRGKPPVRRLLPSVSLTEGEEPGNRKKPCNRKPTVREQMVMCCELYLQDPDYDEFYLHNRPQAEAVAETQC
ncbi:hypothetical protein AAFF_G00277870 [Aldrovandia affinis]|uniref:Ig-like domain-containing protein n=1 Tax=Aldrovandia affinis TaxID=143900 RepID=A0AAD7RA59_9TELE|nr:hypothetical protein AAFF_G00277870 [Aldrovandia affinis]